MGVDPGDPGPGPLLHGIDVLAVILPPLIVIHRAVFPDLIVGLVGALRLLIVPVDRTAVRDRVQYRFPYFRPQSLRCPAKALRIFVIDHRGDPLVADEREAFDLLIRSFVSERYVKIPKRPPVDLSRFSHIPGIVELVRFFVEVRAARPVSVPVGRDFLEQPVFCRGFRIQVFVVPDAPAVGERVIAVLIGPVAVERVLHFLNMVANVRLLLLIGVVVVLRVEGRRIIGKHLSVFRIEFVGIAHKELMPVCHEIASRDVLRLRILRSQFRDVHARLVHPDLLCQKIAPQTLPAHLLAVLPGDHDHIDRDSVRRIFEPELVAERPDQAVFDQGLVQTVRKEHPVLALAEPEHVGLFVQFDPVGLLGIFPGRVAPPADILEVDRPQALRRRVHIAIRKAFRHDDLHRARAPDAVGLARVHIFDRVVPVRLIDLDDHDGDAVLRHGRLGRFQRLGFCLVDRHFFGCRARFFRHFRQDLLFFGLRHRFFGRRACLRIDFLVRLRSDFRGRRIAAFFRSPHSRLRACQPQNHGQCQSQRDVDPHIVLLIFRGHRDRSPGLPVAP